MDWLNNFLNNKPISALIAPSLLSGFSFFGNLANALSDGKLDSNEFHSLMMSASGAQMLILIVIMIALRLKNKDK